MLTPKGTVELVTPRLLLRRFTPEDAQNMFDTWASDEDVARYVTWPAHRDVSATHALLTLWERAYEQPNEYNWCIVVRKTNRPIGSLGVMDIDDRLRKGALGYVIAQPCWGNGFTTEAAAAVLELMFSEVGLHRVEAIHDPRNPASGAVMRKLGMQREGLVRHAHMDNCGRFIDVEQYSILKPEWKGASEVGSK